MMHNVVTIKQNSVMCCRMLYSRAFVGADARLIVCTPK